MAGAAELINSLRGELSPFSQRIREHPYVTALEEGLIPREKLSLLAGEQYHTIKNDLRSFALLLSRQQDTRLMRFLVGSVEFEATALDALFDFASALDVTEDALRAYQPLAGAHAYTAFLGITSAYGTVADMAAAYIIDLEGWGGNCGAISRILRNRYGFNEQEVRFFDHFAAQDPAFERSSLEVMDVSLSFNLDQSTIGRTARLMLEYELMFWDTLLEASSSLV